MRVIKFVSHISCSEVIISPGGKIMVYIQRLSLMQSWEGGGGGGGGGVGWGGGGGGGGTLALIL